MSSHDTPIVAKSQAQYEYDRHHNAVHMRKQVINFAIMIFFTFIAFAVVAADFSKYLIMPFVLLLAGVQVVLQLYSFMHLEDKKTHFGGVIGFFMWMGMLIAFTFFLAFLTIIWW
ncbi:MAG TPA: cytochrome B6 [Lysinibacillus sp.]|jgi:cytochrome c oxidase subunit 4|uniref:Cytochrome B6 n=1 Tax=Lysinibacillus fusiformis TaxID=28031 RepID=A0A2I0V536_9BACI|nr:MULTISPECIES: cytochrome C oxidase subunit IV family protein [Lysinibacillus]HBT73793.1 cytochrome B6 [Lysinibacillus sp.]KUF36334.1 cytochrome B6 [Lysinibacillus sp. F5]MEE3806875.1 cytochrome C oxidase subunit IV family protein [Lysinibacillus fusiformis]PKU53405.1 cytochrome B6 [Lysinibacillus fusiformis]WCH48637.1 cytochrome C oxidase subunit IV family protein [Lysinibacillus sp. OF-1]